MKVKQTVPSNNRNYLQKSVQMLTNLSISPHPSLSDCIFRYTLVQSGSSNTQMTFPMFATHESCLYFFLGDKPKQIKGYEANETGESPGQSCLFGLMTRFEGRMILIGDCKGFIIEFKPNGFNKIFGIPATKICNHSFPAGMVAGNGVDHLFEQLTNSPDICAMAIFADKFLISNKNRQKVTYTNEGITKISYRLLTTYATTHISKYASDANMSIRNFERIFIEQVGVPPKLYCRLLRFNAAIQRKIARPKENWTQIAHASGYFDSMHMIKEFKQFANASPTTLFSRNPDLFQESFCTTERSSPITGW
jgi:AraC-like DNA-binding protein